MERLATLNVLLKVAAVLKVLWKDVAVYKEIIGGRIVWPPS